MGLHNEKKWSFPHFVGIWCYVTPIKAFWEKCYSNTTVRALFLQQKKCSFVYAHTVDMLKSMSQYPLCWCTTSVVTVSPMLVHYKCDHSIPYVGALQVWSQYPLCWCTTSVVTVSPMLVHYKCGHSIPYVGALQVWSQYPLCWCTTSVVTVSPMLVHYKCGYMPIRVFPAMITSLIANNFI